MPAAVSLESPSRARVWMLAARPRTLPVSVGPVLVGTAVAHQLGGAHLGPATAALVGCLLLQIGCNLANDLSDFQRGADGPDRIGPPRASQLGLLAPAQMRVGIAAVFAAATAIGSYLVWVGGWPIAAGGLLSIVAALAYTGGPWPFGYHGLGDPAVFFFFGIVAVMGTTYVQTGTFAPEALAASVPVGSLATAILVVNNVRDLESDAAAGKRTLAVRLGRRAARLEYRVLLLLAFAALPGYAIAGLAGPAVLLPLVLLPFAWRLDRTVATRVEGDALNEALASTARLGLGFCMLLAAGWAWPGLGLVEGLGLGLGPGLGSGSAG